MNDRYMDCVWLTREDIDWVYVRINRSGSTWMSKYLEANDFIQTEIQTLMKHHKLLVLREPLERFMSGIAFYDDLYKKLIKNPKKVIDEYSHDSHIRLQAQSLKNVDLNNCTFIKYGKNWTDNFHQFLKQRNTVMSVKPPLNWLNKITPFDNINISSKEGGFQQNDIDRFFLKKYFDENPKFNKVIMDYLEEDYKLYNKVEWYGTN